MPRGAARSRATGAQAKLGGQNVPVRRPGCRPLGVGFAGRTCVRRRLLGCWRNGLSLLLLGGGVAPNVEANRSQWFDALGSVMLVDRYLQYGPQVRLVEKAPGHKSLGQYSAFAMPWKGELRADCDKFKDRWPRVRVGPAGRAPK